MYGSPLIYTSVRVLTASCLSSQQDTGRPLPKFGEWDVNDPASAEGFTVIFNKARDEKKTGGKPESPGKVDDSHVKPGVNPAKPQPVSFNFITQPRIFFCNSAGMCLANDTCFRQPGYHVLSQ